ncbi:TRAFAC clade GTPase domain-containing protein [Actinocorallia libanotica]|uniref:Double-GTPase 2 domain-containing protein n=1 Tax=Actinocorallia libanotica TaxID=46162 RepID=A0ABN1QGL3_9ACTN
MQQILWILGVVAWALIMFAGFVYLFLPLFALTLACVTLAAFAYYYAAACRTLLPAGTEGPSPVRPADGVYRHYLIGQVWQDWRVLAGNVAPRVYRGAERAVRRLTSFMTAGWWGAFLFPLWAALCAGIVLAAVPVALIGVVLALLYGVVALVGLTGWLVCVALMAGVERLFMASGRILQTCPHPSCYRRIGLPVYACPRCKRRHHRLVPSTAGAFRHVCECGTRLPTTVPLGRYRLTAYCPHCSGRLPDRIGRVRVEPVPFIGGPAAGKTTFMFLAIRALHARTREAGGALAFVEQRHQHAYASAVAEFASGRQLAKTGPELPLATMLDVEPPGKRPRILYLFDPAGELFTGAAQVESLRYLDHSEALVFVLDPFALPEVRRTLTDGERSLPVATSDEDPSDTLQRVLNDLRSRPDRGRQRRVAVVVTKADLLARTSIGRDLYADPRAWLDSLGLGNTLRTLDQLAEEVRVFPSGLNTPPAHLASLVGWVAGLPLASRDGAPATPPPDLAAVPPVLPLRDPWRPKGRGAGLVPLGHQAGRWAILAGLSLLTLTGVLSGLHYLPI